MLRQRVVNVVRFLLGRGNDYWDLREPVIAICEDLLNSTDLLGEVMCEGFCDNYGPHVSSLFQLRHITNQP